LSITQGSVRARSEPERKAKKTVDQSALDTLVAPESLEPLTCAVNERNLKEVLEATLATKTGETFPIREGIPSFVPANITDDQTIRSFSQKWAKHRYYREHTRNFYTDWYLQRYGFGDMAGLRSFLARKQFILDAGTGAGRDAQNLAENSDATVFAIDTAWDALSVANADMKQERVRFVHADLHKLPFPDAFFDLVNCDQVIHHTPDPRAAFTALMRKLKPGGHVCTYVYKKKSPVREFTDDFVREQIKDLDAEEALKLCEPITKLGRTLAKLNVTVNVEEDIPLLGIKKGEHDLQRFFHWNLFKCFWNDEFDFFTNNIINLDWYHPVHCHRFTPDEFRVWFDDGFEVEAWDVQDAGISCRARKL
jgi:SAM-dependent methyltransferase